MDAETANKIFSEHPDWKPVLVDMDDVLADYSATINRELERLYFDFPRIQLKDRRGWDVCNQYQDKEQAFIINEVVEENENFWKSMRPLQSNVENMLELAKTEKVWICSSPSGPYAARDKKEWLEKHVGAEWGDRLILTTDKTLVNGRYLFDARPDVTGERKIPTWDHWLVIWPFNDPGNPQNPNAGVFSERGVKEDSPWSYFFICHELPRSLDDVVKPLETLIQPLITKYEEEAYWEMARRYGSPGATTLLLPSCVREHQVEYMRKALKGSDIVINTGVPIDNYRDVVLVNIGEKDDQNLVYTLPVQEIIGFLFDRHRRNDLSLVFKCYGGPCEEFGIPHGARVYRGTFSEGMKEYAVHRKTSLNPFILHDF